MITILVVLGIIVFFFATALKGEEEDSMFKLRNVYLYLVSFVTLMMILGGIIFTVQNITDVMFPTTYNGPVAVEKSGNLSAEDKKAVQEEQKFMQANQRTESKKSVAKSIAVVLVAFPTFIYHWRKIETEKKELDT